MINRLQNIFGCNPTIGNVCALWYLPTDPSTKPSETPAPAMEVAVVLRPVIATVVCIVATFSLWRSSVLRHHQHKSLVQQPRAVLDHPSKQRMIDRIPGTARNEFAVWSFSCVSQAPQDRPNSSQKTETTLVPASNHSPSQECRLPKEMGAVLLACGFCFFGQVEGIAQRLAVDHRQGHFTKAVHRTTGCSP